MAHEKERELLGKVIEVLDGTELNMSNYNHEDVSRLNNATIEAYLMIKEFLSALPEEKEENIMVKIEKVKDMRPYKKPGDAESYYEYAEGWCDACDALRNEFNPSK